MLIMMYRRMTFGEYQADSYQSGFSKLIVRRGWGPFLYRLAICVSLSTSKEKTFKLTSLTVILPRVIEMQTIAVALLENFEFSLPPQNEKTRIYRKPSRLMAPMVEGNPGAWMGLVIKSVE
jgi:hypothetical protein